MPERVQDARTRARAVAAAHLEERRLRGRGRDLGRRVLLPRCGDVGEHLLLALGDLAPHLVDLRELGLAGPRALDERRIGLQRLDGGLHAAGGPVGDPLERLERKLEKAVRDERYEEAARLRDRITEMKLRRESKKEVG